MEYVGAIDTPQEDRIAGWAVTRFGDACEVTVIVNGSSILKSLSDGPRPDLAAKQQSRGGGGFRIDISAELKPGANTVEVQFPDGSHVCGSPVVRRISAEWTPTPAIASVAPASRVVPRLSPSELEDISLDDVGFAVAHGVIEVAATRRPPAIAPAQATAIAEDAVEDRVPAERWLARWLPLRRAA